MAETEIRPVPMMQRMVVKFFLMYLLVDLKEVDY